jgi:hypothetical protein
MKISKLDAARRQLETAVALYFHEGDPASIHTLVGAAYELLLTLSEKVGEQGTIKQWMAEYIKPDRMKEIHRALNAARNCFKHADADADAVLDYDPKQADYFMMDACWAYRRLSGERLPLFGVFEAWASLTLARDVVHYPGTETIGAEAMKRLTSMSRQAFFDELLPLAYESRVHLPAPPNNT